MLSHLQSHEHTNVDHLFSQHELLLNPTVFPNLKVGDFISIKQPQTDPLYLKITNLDSVKGINHISLQRQVFSLMKFDSSVPCTVEKLTNLQPITIDRIEVYFKDEHLQSRDMRLFTIALESTIAWTGKTLSHDGIDVKVLKIAKNGKTMCCGLITKDTRFTFRCRSGMIYWLIQMSLEMWEYSIHGMLYIEKALTFITETYKLFKVSDVHHELNIILFSRHYSTSSFDPDNTNKKYYEDVYKKVVVDVEWTSLEQFVTMMKKEFLQYPKMIKEHFPRYPVNSNASEGNFLEALNILLFEIEQRHIMDCDLKKTGSFVFLISPSSGVFTINHPDSNIIVLFSSSAAFILLIHIIFIL